MSAKAGVSGAKAPAPLDPAKLAKLRSISQAIEEGDIRKAMLLANAKDVTNMPQCKALKAWAWQRNGNPEEAMGIAMELARTQPTDFTVISPLLNVFRAAGELGMASQLLEHAASASPELNEDVGRQLCFICIRQEDHKKLSNTALRLFKVTGKAEYACWAALGMHCSASSSLVSSGAADAPNVATGGGRGFGIAAFSSSSAPSPSPSPSPAPAAEAAEAAGAAGAAGAAAAVTTSALNALKLAETILGQALDKMTAEQRDSEQLGLLIHTLVRQGKAKEALAAVVEKGGKYYREPTSSSSSSPSHAASPASGGAASTPTPTPVATGDAASASASGSGSGSGGVVAERAEGEDVLESADGSGGRGKAPAPFQAVDTARYTAYLLLQSSAPPEECLGAFADLVLNHDAEDWAYHTGFAVSAARSTIAAIRSSSSGGGGGGDAKAASRLLGPITSEAGATGHKELDGWLHHALPDSKNAFTAPSSAAPAHAEAAGARALMMTAAATMKGGKSASSFAKPSRAALLSLLQLLSVRLEIAARIIRGGEPAAVVAAAKDAFKAASTQYGQLLAHAFTSLAGNASCFSDLKSYLLPLLAATPQAMADKFALDNLTALDGFIASPSVHPVLSMPWHPAALPGSSADAAPSRPALRFSFTFDSASAAIAKPLLAVASSLRAKDVPTKAETAARIEAIVASAREAAQTRDAALAAEKKAAAAAAAGSAPGGEAAKGKDKKAAKKAKDGKKGGKGKGGKGIELTFGDDDSDDDEEAGGSVSKASGSSAAAHDSSDPHGVKQALKPASELLFSAEQEAEITAIRTAIRRFTSAIAVLRFLGVLSLRGSPSHPFPVVSAPLMSAAEGAANDETSLRGVADALVTAWEHTLPLSLTNVGGLRDVQEVDDLILAALGILIELAFHGLYGSNSSPMPSDFASEFAAADGSADWASKPFSEDLSVGAMLRCRQYLFEAALLGDIACEISPYNGLLHLAVLRVYTLIGTSASVTTRFNTQLRVKAISRDTLSHVVMPIFSRFTWPQAINSYAQEVLSFHTYQRPQAGEFVKVALREGNLSSALDLIRMDRRLGESGTKALAKSFSALHSLVNPTSSRTHVEALQFLSRVAKQESLEATIDVSAQGIARLRDNDDREILPSCFDPPSVVLLQEMRMGLNLASSSSSPAVAPKEGFEVVSRHAAVAEGYLSALFSAFPSSGLDQKALNYALAAQLATGSNGGSFERLVRRINRDGTLICRHSAITLLAQASVFTEGSVDGVVSAASSLARWEAVRAMSSPSTTKVPLLAPFLDFNHGSYLPLADSAFTSERSSVRSHLSDLLHSTLRAVFSAVIENKAEAAAPKVAAAVEALQAFPPKLLPFSHLPLAINNTAAAGAAVKVVAFAPDAASMIAVSGVVHERTKDKGSSTGASSSSSFSSSVAVAPGIRPANPSMLAEASLFLLHTAPFMNLAAAIMTQKAAKGSPLASTTQQFASEVSKCTAVLEKDLKAGRDFLETNVEKLMPLINGGFVEAAVATTFVKKWLPRRKEKAAIVGASSSSSSSFASAASFVHDANTQRENKIRAKVEASVLAVGASYANTLATSLKEAEARLQFAKGVAK